jgi:phage-related protein
MNGMELDANNKEGRSLSFLNFFTGVELKQSQTSAINTLMNRIMMIPVMIIYNIIDTAQNAIRRIMAIPMSIGSRISAIVSSFSGTYSTIKVIFRRLTSYGFGMKKVKAMTVDMFATILTNLINSKMQAFDAYIARLSNKVFSLGMDGAKAVPLVGTAVATGTAVNTTATTVDETLDNIASNMKSVETSLDNESNNLEEKAKKEKEKEMFRTEINKKLDDNDNTEKKGGKRSRRKKRILKKKKRCTKRLNY